MKRAIWLLMVPFFACSEPAPPVQATEQRLELTPSELDFGDVPVLGGRVLYVEVKNVGQAAANVWAELDGPLEVEPEAFALPMGEVRTVAIRFRPRETLPFEGGIHFRTSSQNEFFLPVRGRGVERALEIEPSLIHFGEVRVGESRKESFTLQSAADGELRLLLEPGGSRDFLVDSQNFDIPGRGDATLEVIFEPSSRGTHAGWLDISPCVDCAPVRVDFVGVAIAEGLFVGPGSFEFGVVPPGFEHRIEGWIRNDGDAPLTLEEVRLEPPDPAFEIKFDFTLPRELERNEEIPFSLRFAPDAVGTYGSELVVTSSFSERRLGVAGSGGGPLLEAEELSVGPFPLGHHAEIGAIVRNVGDGEFEVQDLELVDPTGVFSHLGSPLYAGKDTVIIPVHVKSEAPGFWEATLKIHTSLDFQKIVEIPLRAYYAKPECELQFDPSDPLHLGIVDGSEALELELVMTHEGEGECLVWNPRFEDEADALTIAEEDLWKGFRLLEPGESWTFHLERAPLSLGNNLEVVSRFVLSHSAVGTEAEIPLSFLQANPLPFNKASHGGVPDTPVGRASIGFVGIEPKPSQLLGFPPLTVEGSDAFGLLPRTVSGLFAIAFMPTSPGTEEATLKAWFHHFSQPYILPPLVADALETCPEPCDWPEATCDWQLHVIDGSPITRWVEVTASITSSEEVECVWYRDGATIWPTECEGGFLPVYSAGLELDLRLFAFDADGRAATCDLEIDVPPLGGD